jgi:hypothetical protein
MTQRVTTRATRIVCASCGRDRQPHSVSDTGRICSTCAGKRRPTEACGNCGRKAQVIARDQHGRAVCNRCYIASRKTTCSACGAVRRVITRTAAGDPFCRACAPAKPPGACGHCGRFGVHQVHDADGRPLCNRCWKRQHRPCIRCDQMHRVAVRFLAGPVCQECLQAVLAGPIACARCGDVRPNAGPDHAGNAICPPCAGLRFRFQCQGCQQFSWPLVKGGTCVPCRDRAHAGRRRARANITAPLDDYDRQVRLLLDTVPEPNRLVVRRYTRWAVTRPMRQKLTTPNTARDSRTCRQPQTGMTFRRGRRPIGDCQDLGLRREALMFELVVVAAWV